MLADNQQLSVQDLEHAGVQDPTFVLGKHHYEATEKYGSPQMKMELAKQQEEAFVTISYELSLAVALMSAGELSKGMSLILHASRAAGDMVSLLGMLAEAKSASERESALEIKPHGVDASSRVAAGVKKMLRDELKDRRSSSKGYHEAGKAEKTDKQEKTGSRRRSRGRGKGKNKEEYAKEAKLKPGRGSSGRGGQEDQGGSSGHGSSGVRGAGRGSGHGSSEARGAGRGDDRPIYGGRPRRSSQIPVGTRVFRWWWR